jgi:hypothetical protein
MLYSLRSLAKHRTTEKEGTNIAEEERNDSVASLLPKKKKKRKQSAQRWEYIPANESASTYWDKGVEGKRKRTIANSSYCDEDASSESENDPEELLKANKEDDCSSESDETISAKDKVTLPLPHFPNLPTCLPNFRSPLFYCLGSGFSTGHKSPEKSAEESAKEIVA